MFILLSFHASGCQAVRLSIHPKWQLYHADSLWILNIYLKFGWMMHSIMKQISIQNGHALPIIAHPWNFEIFNDKLGPGLRDTVTALAGQRFQGMSLKFDGWCTIPWSRLLCKMALPIFARFTELWNFHSLNVVLKKSNKSPYICKKQFDMLKTWCLMSYVDGLVQDCCNSIANALELLQSCTKPPMHRNKPNITYLLALSHRCIL